MSEIPERPDVRSISIVLGVVGLFGFVLLAVLAIRAVSGGEDVALRDLPEIPATALAADEYQPLLEADGPGVLQAEVLVIPGVVAESVEFIATATGPVSDREVYVFKADFGGGIESCTAEYSESGGSLGCSPEPLPEPTTGGASSQQNGGPTVEVMSISGVDPDAVWARFEFDSGFAIVSDVHRGFASIEWLADVGRVVTIEAFSIDGEFLWGDSEPFS